jgi:hypothetical protein
VNVNANVVVRAGTLTFGNSSVNVLILLNNGTTTLVTVGGNTANVTANAYFSGKEMRIPTGNTSQRPTGADGMLRYNDETDQLEIYSDGSWVQLLTTVGGGLSANLVPFDPAGAVAATDVQAAIEELDDEKVAKAGDTMTGALTITRSGASLTAPPTGTIVHVGQEDSANGVSIIDTFSSPAKFSGRRSGGTNAFKAAVAATEVLVRVSGLGHDGSSYSTDRGYVDARASQSWNTTAQGTSIVIGSTANGATSPVDTLMVSANGTSVNSDLTVVAGKVLFGNGVGLTSINASSIAAANTTVVGVTQLASNSVVQAGSNNTTAVTPQSLASTVGVTLQGYDADTAKLDVEDQTLAGGARVTVKNLGNLSGASITPDPGDRPIQKVTNNGAGSILPGSNEGSYILQVLNTTGAGAITTTGWTLEGDSFDTTTTSKFLCSCLVTSDMKVMTVTKVV